MGVGRGILLREVTTFIHLLKHLRLVYNNLIAKYNMTVTYSIQYIIQRMCMYSFLFDNTY